MTPAPELDPVRRRLLAGALLAIVLLAGVATVLETSVSGELLDDPEIDAVLIASRNAQHAPQALAALRAGKHVFVEKPMALTEAE